MTYFFRQQQMSKAWGKEINDAWDEADHPRGKTTPESTPGSFAPKGGVDGGVGNSGQKFRERVSVNAPGGSEWDRSYDAAGSLDGVYAANVGAGQFGTDEKPQTPAGHTAGEAAAKAPSAAEESALRSMAVSLTTAQAYADAQPGKDATDADYRQRSLNYIASASLTALEASKVLPRVIDQYNNFNAKKVTARILAYAPDAKVWIGREMSPVMYITGPQQQLDNLRKIGKRSLRADEVDLHAAGHEAVDYGRKIDPNHEGLGGHPVLHTFDTPVLRLWWD